MSTSALTRTSVSNVELLEKGHNVSFCAEHTRLLSQTLSTPIQDLTSSADFLRLVESKLSISLVNPENLTAEFFQDRLVVGFRGSEKGQVIQKKELSPEGQRQLDLIAKIAEDFFNKRANCNDCLGPSPSKSIPIGRPSASMEIPSSITEVFDDAVKSHLPTPSSNQDAGALSSRNLSVLCEITPVLNSIKKDQEEIKKKLEASFALQEKTMNSLEDKLKFLDERLNNLEKQFIETKKRHDILREQHLAEKERQINDHLEKIHEHEQALLITKQQLEQEGQKAKKLQEEFTSQAHLLKQERQEFSKQSQESKQIIADLSSKKEELEADIAERSQQIEALRRDFKQVVQREESLRTENEKNQTSLGKLVAENASLQENFKALTEKKEQELEEMGKALLQKKQEQEQAIAQSAHEQEKLKTQIEVLSKTIDGLGRDLHQQKFELETALSKEKENIQKTSEQYKLEIESLNAKIQTFETLKQKKEQELEEMQQSLLQQKQEKEQAVALSSHVQEELRIHIADLKSAIEGLRGHLKEQILKHEIALSKEKEIYRHATEQHKLEIAAFEDQLHSLDANREKQEALLKHSKAAEETVSNLSAENKKLNATVKSLKELMNGSIKNFDAQTQLSNRLYDAVKRDKDAFEKLAEEYEQEIHHLRNEIDILKSTPDQTTLSEKEEQLALTEKKLEALPEEFAAAQIKELEKELFALTERNVHVTDELEKATVEKSQIEKALIITQQEQEELKISSQVILQKAQETVSSFQQKLTEAANKQQRIYAIALQEQTKQALHVQLLLKDRIAILEKEKGNLASAFSATQRDLEKQTTEYYKLDIANKELKTEKADLLETLRQLTQEIQDVKQQLQKAHDDNKVFKNKEKEQALAHANESEKLKAQREKDLELAEERLRTKYAKTLDQLNTKIQLLQEQIYTLIQERETAVEEKAQLGILATELQENLENLQLEWNQEKEKNREHNALLNMEIETLNKMLEQRGVIDNEVDSYFENSWEKTADTMNKLISVSTPIPEFTFSYSPGFAPIKLSKQKEALE